MNWYINKDFLSHEGNENSGRYRRGSGERPWQHVGNKVKKRRVASSVVRIMREENRKFGKEPKESSNFLTRNVKVGKDKPKKSKAEVLVGDTAKSTEDITKNVGTILSTINKYKKQNNEPITLTDKELSDAIRRLELERRYSSLTSSQKQSGYEKAMDALSLIGSTTAIAASSVAVAAGIYNIKKRV